MKKFLLTGLITLSIQQIFGQITNIQAGLWSDSAIWVNSAPPSANDSVLLNFNITIGEDAACKYLNTNGHDLTINTGVNLFIGGSILSNPADTFSLKKFVVLDTTQVSPNDTLYIYNYTYDSLNRCIQIKVTDYQNNKVGYTYNYFNGTDNLITSRKLINQVYSDSAFEYFVYSPDGKVLYDSVILFRGSSGRSVFTYNYQTMNDTVISIINANNHPLLIGKYLITKNEYGDIISEKDTSFQYNSGSYFYKNNSDILYTYDTVPCPFFKLYPKRVIGLDYELFTVDDVPFYWFLQSHNTTSEKRTTLPTTSGLGGNNEVFEYFYNSNNMPSSVIYRNLLYGDVYKGVYYY